MKAVGKQLVSLDVDVLNDESRGENLKIASKRRFKEAEQSLTDKAATKVKTMIDSGQRNKKRKLKNKTVFRRKLKKATESGTLFLLEDAWTYS